MAARHIGVTGRRRGRVLCLAQALCLAAALAGGVARAQDAPDASGLSAPASAPFVDGAGAGGDAPTLLPPPDMAATGDPAAPVDDGVIGLIEAPEGAPGLPAEMLPPHQQLEGYAGSAVVTFAETRTQPRARMLGPISHPPVVVELFTAQGCSSCPPADEMLAELAARDDVLALSWHVDYWDYLGWADQFARPDFTRRQRAYTRAWGERAIYTPQMIVGGSDTLIALRPADMMALLQAHLAQPPAVMVSSSPQAQGYRIELTPRAAIANRVAIILVRYAPSRKIEIKAGENRGLTLDYRNVVLAAERIAEWDGRAPLRMTVTPDASSGDAFPPDTRHAILVQATNDRDQRATGPILAAIRLD